MTHEVRTELNCPDGWPQFSIVLSGDASSARAYFWAFSTAQSFNLKKWSSGGRCSQSSTWHARGPQEIIAGFSSFFCFHVRLKPFGVNLNLVLNFGPWVDFKLRPGNSWAQSQGWQRSRGGSSLLAVQKKPLFTHVSDEWVSQLKLIDFSFYGAFKTSTWKAAQKAEEEAKTWDALWLGNSRPKLWIRHLETGQMNMSRYFWCSPG